MAPRESSSPEAIPAILRYSIAVLSVAIATGAALVLTRFSATLTPFLFAVGATVWYAGVGPGILAIVLSVLSLDFFFVTPFYSFSFRHADLVYLAICTVFALVVGWIAAARRRAEEELRDARDALDAKVLERTTDLRESEGKLEEAQRIARVGYWERDVRTGLVNWSEQSNRIFGLAPNEGPVPIARYQELVHSEDRPRIMAAVAEALAGGKRYDVEYRIVRPSGEVRIIHSQGDVTKDEFGPAAPDIRHRPGHHRAQAGGAGAARERAEIPLYLRVNRSIDLGRRFLRDPRRDRRVKSQRSARLSPILRRPPGIRPASHLDGEDR